VPSNFLTDTSFDEALDLLVLRKQALDEGVAQPLPAELMAEADVLQKAASILRQKQAFAPDLKQTAMMAGGGSLLGGIAGLATAKPGRRSWRNALEGALAGGLTGGGLSLVDQAAGTGVGAGVQKAMTGKSPETPSGPLPSAGADQDVLNKVDAALNASNVDRRSGGAIGGALGGTAGFAHGVRDAVKRPWLDPVKMQREIREQFLDKLTVPLIADGKLPDEAFRALHQLRANVGSAVKSTVPRQFNVDDTKKWLLSLTNTDALREQGVKKYEDALNAARKAYNQGGMGRYADKLKAKLDQARAAYDHVSGGKRIRGFLNPDKKNLNKVMQEWSPTNSARAEFDAAIKSNPKAESILRNVELPSSKKLRDGVEVAQDGLVNRINSSASKSFIGRNVDRASRGFRHGVAGSIPGTLLGTLIGDQLEKDRDARVQAATQAAINSPLTSDEVKQRILAIQK
jgi:hypothetical protein